ncbi:MFS transporter [Sinorhizobium alkalisoli]|uniref:MFS transporter n=1 Tax=Sinorhizobium alkalisoli TaxID=1752398 RepID=UPI00124DED40|nr:MFS transporter [Sinorhizobium alkalisoli]MCG5481068.1 MFS transporter [Sinorhizobium alkalisoli]QFI70156.1 NreB protein [Sinorhizobium alkalisoli]
MLSVLSNPTFRAFYLAQIASLVGAGLATVALGLMAFELAGSAAGAVLGTALALKTLTTVGLSPFVTAWLERFSRRSVLIGLEIARGAVIFLFPFVTEVWQVYVLIVLLHSVSAGLVPSVRATIPDILPDEKDYTRALVLTQLSYDMETVASPLLALLLLSLVPLDGLFIVAVAGFFVSAALIASVSLPAQNPAVGLGVGARAVKGLRIYLGTPMLRCLLALTFCAATASAMVLVNTVVLVQSELGLEPKATVLAIGVFGVGSMSAAVLIPRLLDRFPERVVMLAGACLCSGGLGAGAAITGYATMLLLWLSLGSGYALILTPAGRLVARAAGRSDRSVLFAAQFALTHACWFIAYLTAGMAGATVGIAFTFAILAAMSAAGLLVAALVWPADHAAVAAVVSDDRREQ